MLAGMKTLIGSQALAKHMKLNRTPRDVDYFSDRPVDGAETFYHTLLEDWSWSDVANLDELYTIKLSHSYWELRNGSWEKHMFDASMMKRAGAVFIPELHDILYAVWEDTHGVKKANLEQSPEDFFNNNVSRIYEHDSIHASVAYHDGIPLFNAILRDGHAVAVDKSKFFALDYQTKLELVREEVYATALERHIIPSGYNYSPTRAYSWALKKTITSFSKGWFPTFIVDHFEDLRKPTEDFVQTHKDNADRLVRL